MIFSFSEPLIQPSKVRQFTWIVIVAYGLAIAVIFICVMATFPGYVNDDSIEQYNEWYFGASYKIVNSFYLIFLFASNAVTIFAIFQICRNVKKLNKFNSNVTINMRTIIIHAVLISLQTLVALINSIDPFIPMLQKKIYLIGTVLVIVDLIVQLAICFICLSMCSNFNWGKL